MSKSKELVKNTVIIAIGKLFTQFLSFFLLPLYTRYLQTSEYGTVDLILTYITLFAPVVTVQQQMATFRYLVDARNDENEKARIISTSIRSLVIRLLIVLIPSLVASIFIKSNYLYLILINGVVLSFSQLFLQIARGLGENTKYAVGSILSGMITLASNLLLICVFHFGGESILISMALANLACTAFLFLVLKINRYIRINKIDKNLNRKMLKYSWPLVPNSISWWLINASDRTIISAILGVAANGIYAVANKFPSVASSFLNIFNLSWTESASLYINDKDRDQFFSSVAKNTLRIFSSLSVLIISILPFIFNIIVGKDYQEAYNYIPIAVIAVLSHSIVSIYSAIYIAKKLTKKVAATSFYSATINIIVDFALIKFIGLYAAVISTAVAYLSMAIFRHFDVKKYVRIKYDLTDLIMTVIGLALTSVIYYTGNTALQIIGVVLALIYSILQNKTLIKKLLVKVHKHRE